MRDPAPQPVLTRLTAAAIFLVVTVDEGGEDVVRELLPDLGGLNRSVGFRVPEGGLACVTGIGAELFGRLFAGPPPAGLHPFRVLEGPVRTAVSTPGDLLFHLRAATMDLCFELADQLMARLSGVAKVVDEVHGFKYFDERDLLGFVDGTENPDGRAAGEAVFVRGDDPEYAAGSYVIVQKYLHDMAAWHAVSVEEQERVVGRTKLSDIELPDDVKPANSHVALTTIVGEDGEERQIVRDNMPFARLADGERGTYFIGYAADPGVIEQMLENMFIGSPPGNTDRILEFSTPVTGCLFFVPSQDFLDEPPPAPAAGPAHDIGDHSLRIGSLKQKRITS
ncbi:Dyp-type peroxidase [Amycolatopsis alkalitolerans]|uniref:Dyp-type peroxidase n=1 Tax=Amycolatopsis alkalitolerans TaxID=2547244 RepID=UPI00190F4458|nr:Dyp-type peroxidase [Amycolatopsis alkalitolerans]